MFEKRKRRKVAARRLDEAIWREWERHGVVPKGPGSGPFREALREAGLPVGSPEYSQLAIDVVRTASASLSPEDRSIVTKGREGRDPWS